MNRTLLAGVTLAALGAAAPAFAAGANDAATQAKLDALAQQIQTLNDQVQALKQAQAQSDPAPALADLKRSASDQYADLNNQIAAQAANQTKAGIDNGRLQISSADGRFTAAVRVLAQYDYGYYAQSAAAAALPAAYGPDLSSGGNFRRMYLGIQGRVFGDWSYNANFDFGGSGGTETPGHIQSVYLEYDGFAPWALRIGAYPPPANLEDGTASGDTIFLERNAPSDLQRNLAGGDGRDAVSILYTGDRLFGALSFTGDKIGDGAKAYAAAGAAAAPTFDEQLGSVGRLSYLAVATPDLHWLIGVNGTHIFKPADSVANGAATLASVPGAAALNTISLSDPPELTVDSNGITLASTGALPANHLDQWGVETAASLSNLYGQAGYYGIDVSRTPVAYNVFTAASVSHAAVVQPGNNNFDAWYVQGSWILTGESRNYNAATGAFTPPKPAHNFALDGSGWGAFELAARYSDLNLNSNTLDPSNVVTAWTGASPTYTYYNTVRGGDQRIITLGLNWFPNPTVRFAVNYELIQSSRLQSSALPTGVTTTTAGTPVIPSVNGGQNLQTVAIRAQLSL